MATTSKSPLRDRLLSNSPDPIKSSILRDSGMGWGTASAAPSSQSPATSPLRIAKRESPREKVPAVARRTSSSYRHVHTNSLVSKSPFKSQIPTPTPSSRPPPISFPTRRVSGEKRSRPSSMHELAETENDRPFSLKRDRKQSKIFQGLLEKEPVTKSPFKLRQQSTEPKPPPPPPPMQLNRGPMRYNPTPPPSSQIQPPPLAASSGPSPGRSALVSRRMHGPRLSGATRRERRKTVTFHECCDVVEFDTDEVREDEEDVFASSDEEYESNYDEEDPFSESSHSHRDGRDEFMHDEDTSYESIQLSDGGFNPPVPSLLSDPDASITGIVDEMFFSSNAASLLSDNSMTSNTSTPPRSTDISTDLEAEDGVPFGRSHHVDRFLQHHQHQQQSSHMQQPPHFSPRSSPHNSPHTQSPSVYPYNLNLPTHASPLGPPATPPRRSNGIRHSTPPLGRSTHLERIRKAREEEKEDEQGTEDIEKLPVSPSPMKRMPHNMLPRNDDLIPRFDLGAETHADTESNNSANIAADPFEPRLEDKSLLSIQSHDSLNVKDNLTDINTFIVDSDVSIPVFKKELKSEEVGPSLQQTQPNAIGDERSPALTEHSDISRTTSSPASHPGSPFTLSPRLQPLEKTTSKERISQEQIQRKFHIQRNSSSPQDKNVRASTVSPSQIADITRISRSDDLLPALEVSIRTPDLTKTANVGTTKKAKKSDNNEFGLLEPDQRLNFDLGSKFSLGGLALPPIISDVEMKDGIGTRDILNVFTNKPPRPISIESANSLRMGDVDVDMEMKSALDRLMDDVANAGARADESMIADEFEDSCDHSQQMRNNYNANAGGSSRPKVIERAATDSVLLQKHGAEGVLSRTASSESATVPPVPPKDDAKKREQFIIGKRREARRLEKQREDDEESDDDQGKVILSRRGGDRSKLGVGRPSRRRSMSTGDAETIGRGAKRRGNALLDVVNAVAMDDPFSDSIEKELQKLIELRADAKSKYNVRERQTTIYASSSDEKVSHMAGPGDVDAGRAWRTVRRPSDMNEYAKQIKEYRSQDKGKAYGKVFVKVLGTKGMLLPFPPEVTAFTCTLNNGIHFVTTPECQLSPDCKIEQEFELIEHSKLEFTLTLKVKRDPHIIAQYKAIAPSPGAPVPLPVAPPPAVIQPPPKPSGMRGFFSSSPKKSSKEKVVPQQPLTSTPYQPLPVPRLIENLARHLKPDGTLARAFICFKDIASRCDTRLFETSYPLIGQRLELGGKLSTMEVGEIVLQMFRLPPLPGIPQDQLPQSLEECHRGLRHINWHKVTYFQGTLTQSGGDCSTWRRRQLRVIGSNLIAFNDVTKKATATIDLKKAIAVEDDQARNNVLSPASGPTRKNRYADEYDGLYGVERSFRLIFPQDQEIIFFADTDEEKAKWLEVLRALVGRIPPHPLWAELLWQRQEEIVKRMAAAQHTITHTSSIDSSSRVQTQR